LRGRVRSLALILIVSAALALVGSASAAFPGTNGRIAFSRGVGTGADYDIYTMRADGTRRRAVVASRFLDLDPSWSGSGRRLAFVRDVDDRLARGNFEIYTKNLRTGNVVRRTHRRAVDWMPAFSPGGRKIAFSSDRGPGAEFDIFVLDLPTGDVTRIRHAGDDFSPTWSAGGRFLVWSGYIGTGRADIFRRAVAGGAITNLTGTPGLSEEEPNLNPAGTRIVYQRWRSADTEIVIETLATGVTRVLTRNSHSDNRPVFSPNGRRIAWERHWDDTDTSGQIWTMRTDGSRRHALTPRRFASDSPDWQAR
jgi:Tol biopolymer transport system component